MSWLAAQGVDFAPPIKDISRVSSAWSTGGKPVRVVSSKQDKAGKGCLASQFFACGGISLIWKVGTICLVKSTRSAWVFSGLSPSGRRLSVIREKTLT